MKSQAVLLLALVGCAKARSGPAEPDGGCTGPADASCGEFCDQDGDGVVDGSGQCPNTPSNEPVNHLGCSDSQLTATLVPFPPFNLMWTPTGDLGRAGGFAQRRAAAP